MTTTTTSRIDLRRHYPASIHPNLIRRVIRHAGRLAVAPHAVGPLGDDAAGRVAVIVAAGAAVPHCDSLQLSLEGAVIGSHRVGLHVDPGKALLIHPPDMAQRIIHLAFDLEDDRA